MRKFLEVNKILQDRDISTKVYIYFSTATAGDDYDSYENNKTFSNLNPKVIKGYVRQISQEALVYKQYGLHNMGAIEILCKDTYKSYFENCNKVVVNSVQYQVFKEGVGNRAVIQERPGHLIRVVLSKNG